MQFFRYSLCIFRCSSLHEHLAETQVEAPQQEDQVLRKQLQDFMQAKLADGECQQTTVEQSCCRTRRSSWRADLVANL